MTHKLADARDLKAFSWPNFTNRALNYKPLCNTFRYETDNPLRSTICSREVYINCLLSELEDGKMLLQTNEQQVQAEKYLFCHFSKVFTQLIV